MGRRESGFHRKTKRLIAEAGKRLGYDSSCEKSLSVSSKRFQVDAAWLRNGELKHVFEVERGFTWDSMHVLGHLVVLNAYAASKQLKLSCVFVFDENLRTVSGVSAHSQRLRRTWDWYVKTTSSKSHLAITTLPIYWNRKFELNTKNLTVESLLDGLTRIVPGIAA